MLAISGASLFGLSLPSQTHAAAAASSRLYVSQLAIRQIARGLVFGVGREVQRYINRLPPENLRRFIEEFDPARFAARIETLRGEIDVAFDSLVLAIDGEPLKERLAEFVGALSDIATEDEDWNLNDDERRRLKAAVEDARQRIREHIDAGRQLTINYNVSYRQARFRVANQARRGHVRLDLNLLTAVRMFNGASFVTDLEEQPGPSKDAAHTRVHTSLWTDVCIGRREGPLVRRIAEREIRSRQCDFLARTENEVRLLVNSPEQSRLSQMLPELIRRIAEGERLG
jgi:hypothetical protein